MQGGDVLQTFRAAILIALWLLAAAPAHAQTSGMPSDIEWRLAELGAVINPAETAKLYAPLQESEPYAGVTVARDINYGPDSRNLVDVFAPAEPGAPRPVLLFVHGGGFTAGGRRTPGSPFYDNIMLFAVRNGMIGVNMTYRLAPQHP